MKTKTTDCIGCTGVGLPCIGHACPNHGYYYIISCDRCGTSDGIIYTDGENELCVKCMAKKHKEKFINEFWDDIVDDLADNFVDENFDVVE